METGGSVIVNCTIGVISDTHGLLRSEALAALAGCDRIIHAGDLGQLEIFEQLSRVVPTIAVRGNVDREDWAQAFPETLTLSVGGISVYVLHDLHALDFAPGDRGINMVISGHLHRPVLKEIEGVLFLNPGSAGPRRFSLPITIARLEIRPASIQVELVDVLSNMRIGALTTVRRLASA